MWCLLESADVQALVHQQLAMPVHCANAMQQQASSPYHRLTAPFSHAPCLFLAAASYNKYALSSACLWQTLVQKCPLVAFFRYFDQLYIWSVTSNASVVWWASNLIKLQGVLSHNLSQRNCVYTVFKLTVVPQILDEFVEAVMSRWPKTVLQFEDFQLQYAHPLLQRYKDQHLVFNDDIQVCTYCIPTSIHSLILSLPSQPCLLKYLWCLPTRGSADAAPLLHSCCICHVFFQHAVVDEVVHRTHCRRA